MHLKIKDTLPFEIEHNCQNSDTTRQTRQLITVDPTYSRECAAGGIIKLHLLIAFSAKVRIILGTLITSNLGNAL